MNIDGWDEFPFYAALSSGTFQFRFISADEMEHWATEAVTTSHTDHPPDRMNTSTFELLLEADPSLSDDLPTLNVEPVPDVIVMGRRDDGTFGVLWVSGGSEGSGAEPHPTLVPGGDGGSSAVLELFDACAVERSAAETALNLLYGNSPTARALIDAMVANGTGLNLITASLSGSGAQARFDTSTNQVLWDPFVYVQGSNVDGSTYTLAPIMVLAHEIVHAGHAGDPAYQGHGSESLVMQIANQIAAELNAATRSTYDTTRDSHERTGLYNTTSPTSITFSLVRPGCDS